jgi:hypothetical protein
MKIDARQGTYMLSASSAGVRSARVNVSEPRPSSQDELLLP